MDGKSFLSRQNAACIIWLLNLTFIITGGWWNLYRLKYLLLTPVNI